VSGYDPDPPSRDELAREVLDREELGDYQRSRDERLRIRAAGRRRREQMRAGDARERRELQEREEWL
jgi:hypothetical protein